MLKPATAGPTIRRLVSCTSTPEVGAIPVEPGDCCFIEELFGCEAATWGDLPPGAVCSAVRLQRRILTVLRSNHMPVGGTK